MSRRLITAGVPVEILVRLEVRHLGQEADVEGAGRSLALSFL